MSRRRGAHDTGQSSRERTQKPKSNKMGRNTKGECVDTTYTDQAQRRKRPSRETRDSRSTLKLYEKGAMFMHATEFMLAVTQPNIASPKGSVTCRSEEREAERQQDASNEVAEFILGLRKEQDTRKLVDCDDLPPMDSDKWKAIGRSYRVTPEPEPLSEETASIDFYCNSLFKALASGNEGAVDKGERDDHTPMTAMSGELALYSEIDELGIEHLKIEHAEMEAAKSGCSPDVIASIAGERSLMVQRLHEVTDDEFCVYRPPRIIPRNDNFSKVKFAEINYSDLQFVTHMVMLVELNSGLTQNRRCNIMMMINEYIPLIINARKKREMPVHFVAPALHVIFLVRLFDLLARFDEYLDAIKFVPLRAAFKLVNGLHPEQNIWFHKNLKRLYRSIATGGALSRLFCETRNVSIAARVNEGAMLVNLCNECVLEGLMDLNDMVSRVANVMPGQNLHCIKFTFRGGVLRPRVVRHDMSSICARMSVFPLYAALHFQPPADYKPSAGHVLNTGNLTFAVGVTSAVVDDMDSEYTVTFGPGTSSSIISLNDGIL